MEELSGNKYEHLKNILFSLFSTEDNYKHKEKLIENIPILIDEKDLKKEISKQWIYLLGNSEDFNFLVDEFIEKKFGEWSKKLEAFKNSKSESEFKKYIKENFSLGMLIRYEAGYLTRNDILQYFKAKEPKIKNFYHGHHRKYLNFLIYDDNLLFINLHLKLKEYTTGAYGLLMLVSFWIEEFEFFDTIDLRLINKNYSSSIICYKLLNKMLSLGFSKLSLFDANDYWKEKYYPNIKNEWAKSLPHLFITVGEEIINENPKYLFEELVSNLNQIQIVIDDHEKSPILNPNEWYNSLSIEVQTFIEKGKELFLKIEEKYQEMKKGKTVDSVSITEPKENELCVEDVVLLFKDIFQKDQQNERIDEINKGFRTINHFFKECEDNLKGKSIMTLYTYFKKWNDLDYYLESRESRGQGGGIEYRYKQDLFTQKFSLGQRLIEAKDGEIELFQKERIQIQHALNYYNNEKYDEAKILLLNISKDPSKDLINEEQLYFGIIYYIGRCYQHSKDFLNAITFFNRIFTNNNNLINANYHLIESGLEAGKYSETFQIIEYTIKSLKEFLKIFDLANYGAIYDDLEFTIRSISRKHDSLNESLRPYIEYLEKDDFSKYIIGLNKVKPDLRILNNPLDEKDYNIIYNNFMLTEKFYIKLMQIWFLKAECFRRYIYENIVNGNTDMLNESIKELINFLKEIQKLNSKSRFPFLSVLSFVNYFIGLTKLFNLDEIQNLLEENFPEGKNLHFSHYRYNFLKRYNEIYSILNAINESFYNPKRIFGIKVKKLREFNFSLKDKSEDQISLTPEMETELLFIKISLLEKYVLNELINEENVLTENIKNRDTENIEEIFRNWEEFHFPYQSYRNLINYNKLFSEFKQICQKHNLEMYKPWIKKLKVGFFNKLAKVREQREVGRNYALNRVFKILHKDYHSKTYEFEILMEEIDEDLSIEHFLYNSIQSKIKSVIHEKVGKIRVKIDLSNKKLLKHILSYMNERGFYIGRDLDFTYNLWFIPEHISEENVDIIEIYCKTSLTYEKGKFEGLLDKIPLDLFQVINLNADELIVQVSEKYHDNFKTYFEDQFLKEYENEFFEFSVITESNKNRFRIKIVKL